MPRDPARGRRSARSSTQDARHCIAKMYSGCGAHPSNPGRADPICRSAGTAERREPFAPSSSQSSARPSSAATWRASSMTTLFGSKIASTPAHGPGRIGETDRGAADEHVLTVDAAGVEPLRRRPEGAARRSTDSFSVVERGQNPPEPLATEGRASRSPPREPPSRHRSLFPAPSCTPILAQRGGRRCPWDTGGPYRRRRRSSRRRPRAPPASRGPQGRPRATPTRGQRGTRAAARQCTRQVGLAAAQVEDPPARLGRQRAKARREHRRKPLQEGLVRHRASPLARPAPAAPDWARAGAAGLPVGP